MWCRSVWIQPKILFGHCWLFFQFFWSWRSHLYDRKCCDPFFEAPFCSIRYTEMRCVWFRPPVCVQPLCEFLFDMAHIACYFKSGTPKWEWESRGCCEISQEYAQTHTTRHTYIYTRVHALVPCTNIINIPFSLGCGRFGTEFSTACCQRHSCPCAPSAIPQTTGTITRLCVLLNSVPNRPHPNEKEMLMMFVHGTSAWTRVYIYVRRVACVWL